jgi:hypothetical protein
VCALDQLVHLAPEVFRPGSPPFAVASRACRWLLPWAIVFALSSMTAYTATTALTPTLATDPGVPPSTFANSKGIIMRVTCPDDPSFTADVRVDSVQALDVLMAASCEMRRPECA